MMLFHEGWRERVSLLVSGALDGAEREATLAHLALCARCREERHATEGALALLAADPALGARPPIPLGALRARVEARLDEREQPPRRLEARRRGHTLPALAAAAVVAFALVALLRGPAPSSVSRPGRASLPEDVLRRMEAKVARHQAARYLSEAQDVLVTVAAAPRPCERTGGRVDVGDEARRSRELLARRALLLELDRAEVAPARPVLQDVERMLREVASLESCARAGDLEKVQGEILERRLLMKIDLMTRELHG